MEIGELQSYINYAIANYNTDIVDRGDRFAYYYNSLLEKVLRVYSKHSKEIDKWVEEEKLFENLKYEQNSYKIGE